MARVINVPDISLVGSTVNPTRPTQEQAPCGCNQNYYDQMVGCLRCQSSSSAHYSVKELSAYQLVCQSYHQTWKEINLPSPTTTTATTTTTTLATTISPSVTSTPTSDQITRDSNDGLSSGAIAGIVVSIIALIVALSVAAYVWGRRKRDNARDMADLDEFKYRDTHSDSYMEAALPQYTGMIQPSLPPISKVSNLRVMNPDSEDEDATNAGYTRQRQHNQQSFEVQRNNSPGWRRGSFDDD
ncbi:hypothetical protein BGX27_000453 [Mortierella sp. AM989]|nr:hypothetical protein BGX27_000453 [Mortierella sp. AM989]